jgi:hypothetical protein
MRDHLWVFFLGEPSQNAGRDLPRRGTNADEVPVRTPLTFPTYRPQSPAVLARELLSRRRRECRRNDARLSLIG